MYGLSIGVAQVGNTLPSPVYALLSGLNAATVGIITLAAVRLSERAITDKLTRFLVYLGGIMGMLYTALWYYPAVMAGASLVTWIWDMHYLHDIIGFVKARRRKPATKKRNLRIWRTVFGSATLDHQIYSSRSRLRLSPTRSTTAYHRRLPFAIRGQRLYRPESQLKKVDLKGRRPTFLRCPGKSEPASSPFSS